MDNRKERSPKRRIRSPHVRLEGSERPRGNSSSKGGTAGAFLYGQGKDLLSRGRQDGAMEIWRKAAERDADPAAVWVRLARSCEEHGDFTNAVALYARALDAGDHSPETWFSLGNAHDQSGDLENAE